MNKFPALASLPPRPAAKPQVIFLAYSSVVAYCAVIFYLSSQVFEVEGLPRFSDKIVHLFEYAVLGILSLWALLVYGAHRKPLWALGLAFGFTCLFGLSDEFHQSFVPGRTASWSDVIADAAGALLGVFVAVVVLSRKPLSSS